MVVSHTLDGKRVPADSSSIWILPKRGRHDQMTVAKLEQILYRASEVQQQIMAEVCDMLYPPEAPVNLFSQRFLRAR